MCYISFVAFPRNLNTLHVLLTPQKQLPLSILLPLEMAVNVLHGDSCHSTDGYSGVILETEDLKFQLDTKAWILRDSGPWSRILALCACV